MKLIKLGLTGSIGMGKTRTTLMFKSLGIPTFDSDKKVHDLFTNNNNLKSVIAKNFDGVVSNNIINRNLLGEIVFQNKKKRNELENIVHPLVRLERKKFTLNAIRNRFPIVLYDIPLLFETNSLKLYDYIIVVTAPKFIQDKRVLKRPGMTKEKYENINLSQMPDFKKKKKADFIVHSGLGIAYAFNKVKFIVNQLRNIR
ncbi:MAG: dephospho-CoA kinase [Rhodospirillaceae bacterium]|mgnify:CR=1 FL=1|nr:dephospho-CoA kinase [Rhodospirillaceae bacterium]|tara:strand:+ start:850 stop:1449 length:600 start_codon:yes stop_codon:yes gene_type:complete